MNTSSLAADAPHKPAMVPSSKTTEASEAAGPDGALMEHMQAACAQACRAIAPAWPLDRAIAVNPHWCRVDMPVRRVAARMAVLGGIQVFPTRRSQQNAWEAGRIAPADLAPYESDQTTHFSVVDKDGNAVSNTYTINFNYGSGLVADGTGVLMNNEMDDFSAKPGTPNGFGLIGGDANAIQAGKRPLSSMTPTIVLKDGKVWLVTGSPGGARIITTVLQVVMNMIDHGMNVAEASAAPRVHHQWLPDVFTQGVLWTGLIAAWAQQSPLTLQDAVTGVLVGFITFYSLRWIAGIVLRKEALGMGDVLLFAALGGWVGALSLPNVALIASCCGLIYAVIIKKGSTTLPFGPCLSLGGIATIYLQALF